MHREKRNAYRVLVGKGPLGRPRRMWKDNTKMDLKRNSMGWYGLDRPVVGSCEHGIKALVPQNVERF
jgi:hypothetical protein